MTPTDPCATGASRCSTCAASRWAARIAELVGPRDLTVTATTYTHVLVDEGELDYPHLLQTSQGRRSG
jgi:hypothetical protein